MCLQLKVRKLCQFRKYFEEMFRLNFWGVEEILIIKSARSLIISFISIYFKVVEVNFQVSKLSSLT